jgi:hypothetical protein
VSLPAPKLGLVLRYSYLWSASAAQGREEGEKDRPAVVVLIIDDIEPSHSGHSVFVLPITHSRPVAGTEAIEIPIEVARKAGLDASRSWVILSEFNEFVWPGFDLRMIPGRSPRTVAYGFLTPGFFATLRTRWLALDDAGKSKPVSRNE